MKYTKPFLISFALCLTAYLFGTLTVKVFHPPQNKNFDARRDLSPATDAVVLKNREPRVVGTENTGARIVIIARSNSWIQVRDAVENNVLITLLLVTGDRYMVPNRKGLRLSTGSAGGLEITIDGEIVPALDPAIPVQRDVSLDIDQLMRTRGTP